MLPELAAHLLDHGAGRPAHGPDGQGREDEKTPFLWQVVNEFEKNHSDMLKTPPKEFLTLTAWLMHFWRDDDPKELKDYFNPATEVAQP